MFDMARQEYDLELRRYDGQGWRAPFFPSGFERSLTSHAGSAWALSPWGGGTARRTRCARQAAGCRAGATRLDANERVARVGNMRGDT
jgi:hypothetical protein